MKKTKGFIEEFKEFISRGNVMDMAVGIIMGMAFTAIVNSLVNDLIMPFIGMIFGGVDFTNLKYVIRQATESSPEAALYYGNFIQAVVDFLLIAFVIFIVIKAINSFHKNKGQVPAGVPAEVPAGVPAEVPAGVPAEVPEKGPAEVPEKGPVVDIPIETAEGILLLREIRDALKK